jgi:hypothetical protein
MTERYLVALNDFHSPHHEPGHLFDVERIVFRLPDPRSLYHGGEKDLSGILVPPGSAVEFDYPAGEGGFRAVSRALAYQLRVLNTRALSQRDSLVLVAMPRFTWRGVVHPPTQPATSASCWPSTTIAELSHERGAWVRTGEGPASWEQLADPLQPLTEEAKSLMRTALLRWALDRNRRPA